VEAKRARRSPQGEDGLMIPRATARQAGTGLRSEAIEGCLAEARRAKAGRVGAKRDPSRHWQPPLPPLHRRIEDDAHRFAEGVERERGKQLS
jgi:hypothetical protein